MLETLHLSFNQLDDDCIPCLLGLKFLNVLDLSNNQVSQEEAIETLKQLQQLRVIYLQQNPVVFQALLKYLLPVHICTEGRLTYRRLDVSNAAGKHGVYTCIYKYGYLVLYLATKNEQMAPQADGGYQKSNRETEYNRETIRRRKPRESDEKIPQGAQGEEGSERHI